MSETERGEEMVRKSERKERRAKWASRIGWAVLILLLVALAVIQIRSYQMGQQREDRIDALQEQTQESDSAAEEVASDRQRQARSVTELCKSGAIKQDDAGKAVCEEAAQAATEDPAQTVAQAKGEQGPEGPRGPSGPRGPRGPTGEDGADGADGAEGPQGDQGIRGVPGDPGTDGSPGESGSDGSPGAPGEDGSAGPAGEDGSQGPAGPKGDTGDTGPKGDTGDTGPQGPAGPAGPKGDSGQDGADGRGITDATCNPDDGRWDVTYSDGTTEDAGPCIASSSAPETPEPEPTQTQEVNE